MEVRRGLCNYQEGSWACRRANTHGQAKKSLKKIFYNSHIPQGSLPEPKFFSTTVFLILSTTSQWKQADKKRGITRCRGTEGGKQRGCVFSSSQLWAKQDWLGEMRKPETHFCTQHWYLFQKYTLSLLPLFSFQWLLWKRAGSKKLPTSAFKQGQWNDTPRPLVWHMFYLCGWIFNPWLGFFYGQAEYCDLRGYSANCVVWSCFPASCWHARTYAMNANPP